MGPFPFICGLFSSCLLAQVYVEDVPYLHNLKSDFSDPCKVFLFFLHHTWNLPCAYLRHSSGLTVYLPMNSEMLFTWTVAENGYMNAWSPSLLLWYSTLPISKKVPKSCWQIVSLLWWCAAMLSTFELSAFPFSSLITLLQLEIKIFAVSL